MATFSDLFARLDPDPRVRGKQFEHVCKWFLTNDPMYRTTLRKVWLWEEWTGRWGIDAGIDLVAEDHDGRLWAIQCKAYKPESSITKADVDKFLAESSRAVFSYRLLIATTDNRHYVARRTMEDQEKKVGFVGLSELLTSEVDWRTNPFDVRPSPPPKPANPREHQWEAIRNVLKGFTKSDRGRLIMACGTGKTLTSLFIKEKIAADRTLILVPSLSLLKQTMQVWTVSRRVPFEPLPVCSDQTVGLSGEDAAVAHTSELGVPVTTNPHEIAAFLRRRSGPRVVFSTYQSSPQIAAAFRLGRVPAFDLVIADEAHRVAGPITNAFATVLDPAEIKAHRRLFMTATPRYYTGRVLKAAIDAEYEIASMDDEAKFGTLFHRLSFGEAIERNLLTDYQVVIVGVDNPTYQEWADKGTLVTRDGKTVTNARTLAGQIGLAKSMRKYNLRRTISFHSRVARAAEFAREMPDVIAWMPARQRPKGKLWARHASGEMSAGERHILLRHLSRLDEDERGLLTNARCLSEGVDVPTLDGVAFIDPRKSEVDIVQAVGRAIRKVDDKTVGTIVIPVFIDGDTDPELALNDSVFKPVWDVIQALRAHDEELGEQLDALRRELGRKGGNPKLPGKIHVDVPRTVGSDFIEAFEARLLQKTSASWEFWMGLMDQFVEEHAHALVPVDYKVRQYKLGSWVAVQRYLHGRDELSQERTHRLEELPGWSWDPVADNWTQHYDALKLYAKRIGHARPPQSYVRKGLRLGQWVAVQRRSRENTSPERVALLEALPGWSWDPHTDRWEQAYAVLVEFANREGHARVHKDQIEDGVRLGDWVIDQRVKRDKLAADQRQRLEALPGWIWDARKDRWHRKFELLNRFQRREGHALVPQGHIEDGIKLGSWVREQRGNRATLSDERRTLLEAIPGWTWDPHAEAWERAYTTLLQFVERERHARVPKDHAEGGIKLGGWVTEQRANRQKMPDERRKRLQAIPGWSWNSVEDSWMEHLELLRKFSARTGATLVPVDYVEDGLKLGQWVRLRRREHKKLSSERRALLEAIPGWFWGTKSDYVWNHKLALLKKFAEREGYARPSYGHIEDGVRLGGWVVEQRAERQNLSAERKAALEAVPGWSWTVSKDAWDEKYEMVWKFADREGHARVPQSHVEDGVYLGKWVSVQRRTRNKLTAERRARLESLPGWSWDPYADQWEKAFKLLEEYTSEHGTSRVPYTYKHNGFRLGVWVYEQRSQYAKGKLDPLRQKRLKRLRGWTWDART
ncbi:DEAD/DEAH box helicase [Mycobacterium paraintracellulare]|uniref:DEAD/DEAH box helicase n=1 Tax=Mycobacterium paraintracellulare TaxID=1138383 RepID=UPI00191642F1|nr:DEAD/DEAH box helicase [Mycobacterium paraintracellulare]